MKYTYFYRTDKNKNIYIFMEQRNIYIKIYIKIKIYVFLCNNNLTIKLVPLTTVTGIQRSDAVHVENRWWEPLKGHFRAVEMGRLPNSTPYLNGNILTTKQHIYFYPIMNMTPSLNSKPTFYLFPLFPIIFISLSFLFL